MTPNRRARCRSSGGAASVPPGLHEPRTHHCVGRHMVRRQEGTGPDWRVQQPSPPPPSRATQMPQPGEGPKPAATTPLRRGDGSDLALPSTPPHPTI